MTYCVLYIASYCNIVVFMTVYIYIYIYIYIYTHTTALKLLGISNVDFDTTGQLLIIFCTRQILEKKWE